jgi:hypothetical protein
MGYNLAITIIQCGEVQLYSYEVAVKMAEQEILFNDGGPTGQNFCPQLPYVRTTIRKELQRIHLQMNNAQFIHTAVMTCKGPESGLSCIVIS